MNTFRWLASLEHVPASDWNRLLASDYPFLKHEFLHGLEQHGCLREQWGWTAQHATLWDDEQLIAAAPAYRKHNSHGEFVFDQAFAQAYEHHGLAYYPKLLLAVPYSPVPGPRIISKNPQAARELLEQLTRAAEHDGLSSVHANFCDANSLAAFDEQWIERNDIQFHWHNQDWADFDQFLAALNHRKRKNIRQERRRVTEQGYVMRRVSGAHITGADVACMHGFYQRTFAEKFNAAALTLEFFQHLATQMPEQLMLCFAERDAEPVAGALFLQDQQRLYGRYWGSSVAADALHFEVCYYQGIEHCLERGLAHFEPGAQGEHKHARGFLPTITESRHRFFHPEFAKAIAPWCARECRSIQQYHAMMEARSPFRSAE